MLLRHGIRKKILLFFFISIGTFRCFGQNNPYNYLYEDNKLIADTNLLMDSKLEYLNSNLKINYKYLYDQVKLLNLINPTRKMIETGSSPKIIIKLYLKKQSFSIFIIDSLELINVNKNSTEQLELFNNLKKDLINQPVYSVVQNDTYYLQLPVKINYSLVKNQEDVGISKFIKDGWFTICIKTQPIIQN